MPTGGSGHDPVGEALATFDRGLEGLDEATVDERLAGLNYVYATPSHQCPTGVTMPLARREALLRSAGGRPSDALRQNSAGLSPAWWAALPKAIRRKIRNLTKEA